MFKFLQKKKQVDPICGMTVGRNAIMKHGEKFCSEACIQKYEDKNQIASNENVKKGGCCG